MLSGCVLMRLQEDAIADIVRVMRQHHQAQPATLFVVGSYRIGKERAYLGAAKALGWKVHVNADKLRVISHDVAVTYVLLLEQGHTPAYCLSVLLWIQALGLDEVSSH